MIEPNEATEAGLRVRSRTWARLLTGLAAGAFLLAGCGPKGEELYGRAEASLAQGDSRAAVIDLKNLVKSEPQNARARALLALALVDSGEVDAAAVELQKAKDLGAPPDALLLPDCRIEVILGEFDAVLERCRPDGGAAASRPALHVIQGHALVGLKRQRDALPEFRAALDEDPDNLDALLGLAVATFTLEGRDAARPILDAATDAMKRRPDYWMALGRFHAEAGDFAKAEEAFVTASETEGAAGGANRFAALAATAEMQMRQGKVAETQATVERLAKASPQSTYVKQMQAQLAAATGDLEKARIQLEAVVSQEPDNQSARLLLGTVQLGLGNLGQAEMHLANVVSRDPENMRAQRLLAETRSRLGSPAATLASMKASLDPGSASPALLVLAGRLSLQAGDREQGLSYFAQAAARSGSSDSPSVQLEIASGYIVAEDYDRAIELLQAMPASGASGYQREYLLMTALLRKGDKQAAVAEAERLVERSGDDPEVRNLVAGVYAAAGEGSEGRLQLEEALKLKPGDSATLLNLARLDLAEGRTAEAETGFRKVLEVDPGSLPALLGIAAAAAARQDMLEAEKWLVKATQEHPDSVETKLALAQFYLGVRDQGKARSVIDEAARQAPDNGAVANVRGLVQLEAKDLPGATASFEEAAKLAPSVYAYRLNLARARLLANDLDSALAELNSILAEEPGFQPALTLGFTASLRAGQIDKAAGFMERLQKSAPESPATYRLEGDFAMAQKRYRDALESYRKAGSRGKDSALVVAEYSAAVAAGAAAPDKVLEDWIAKNPADATVTTLLAGVREQRGDRDGAIALYERALQASPGNAVLLNNLAVQYQAKGDARALETARSAYNAAPESAAIQDTYGWILLEKGETSKAVDLLRKAATGLSTVDEVQYHYAAALAATGEDAAARKIMRRITLENLPPSQRERARELLERLGR